jgi:hypothetical protein
MYACSFILKKETLIRSKFLENQHFGSKALYLRARRNDEGCYGTGQFDIIVEPIPKSKLLKKEYLRG